MRRIIDTHMHLGDLYHANLNVTFKKTYQYDYRPYPDVFEELGENGYNAPLVVPDVERHNQLIDAAQYHNWEHGGLQATLDAMDYSGITYVVNLPILPGSTFDEGLAASKLDPRILNFTCCDFDLPVEDMLKKLKKDIVRGAKGLKLHPIIQNVSPRDERLRAAMELFGDLGLPITSHCGANDYYKMDSPYYGESNKEYGELYYYLELIDKYPDYVFIPAHCGGFSGGEMEELGDAVRTHGWKNVYVETSMRGREDIEKMIDLFGEDKVMYGTDAPSGPYVYTLEPLLQATEHDPELQEKVLYRNAAKMLNL
ncbi:MAG: amidohydrolase family protein [Anaerovoracaceae bacterium]